MMLKIVFLCTLISTYTVAFTQKQSDIKFGRVETSDFAVENIKADTSYGGVIIAEIGKSYFDGNTDGWFTLIHEVKKRIYIVNKKGFDLATVAVYLYQTKKNNNTEEKLESLKATTYNLVNGKIEETKLDKDLVFKENINENYVLKKFTMPAVKEGSIIEYSYTIKSVFLFNLQPWDFQGPYPKIWSEYSVQMPEAFDYITLTKGYLPFHSIESKTKKTNYLISQATENTNGTTTGFERRSNINYESLDKIAKWVVKDAPALKEENFTTSLKNHISRIEFQQSGINIPGSEYKSVMRSWNALSKDLMGDYRFGEDVFSNNKWIESSWMPTPGAITLNDAIKTFHYVQNSIKHNGKRGMYRSQSLKETFQNKSGNTADINLLLTMMLNKQGFTVNPVILSTRSHGIVNETYPLLFQYNYVICKLILNNKTYYLDATGPHRSFNYLPQYCYNGSGRSIHLDLPSIEQIKADSSIEEKFTNVMLMLDEKKSNNWTGSLQTSFGNMEAENTREIMASNGLSNFQKKITASYPAEITTNDFVFSNLDSNEKELTLKYNISIDNNNADIIYFSPMLKEAITENYFKSQERQYPVEMPFKIHETYMLKLFIPEGYIVDELPKSERVNLENNDGMFEYLVRKNADDIDIRVIIKLNKATFPVEDYETLRAFFDLVVKKEAEQIVFKKK